MKLGNNEASLLSAARGMLTTDTVHKLAGRTLDHRRPRDPDHRHGQRGGDDGTEHGHHAGADPDRRRTLTPPPPRRRSSTATDDSFNCISVDGHMSTNDTVLLLANGAAGGEPLAGERPGSLPAGPGRGLRRSGQGDSRPTAKGPRT